MNAINLIILGLVVDLEIKRKPLEFEEAGSPLEPECFWLSSVSPFAPDVV